MVLMQVEIVMGLEEEFGISVEEESSEIITTIQEAADLIDKLVDTKAWSHFRGAGMDYEEFLEQCERLEWRFSWNRRLIWWMIIFVLKFILACKTWNWMSVVRNLVGSVDVNFFARSCVLPQDTSPLNKDDCFAQEI